MNKLTIQLPPDVDEWLTTVAARTRNTKAAEVEAMLIWLHAAASACTPPKKATLTKAKPSKR